MFRVGLAIVILCSAAQARDYYISPRGDDANPATGHQPWRSIAKLNATRFAPGDRILFEAGQTFPGTLLLDADDSGVEVRSYGRGRAVIDAGSGRAIALDGCNRARVSELILRGAGRNTGSTASGLVIANASGVEVSHVEVSGFLHSGIEISGLEDGRITHVHVHDNGFAGISSAGKISRNLYIAHCLADNNPGDPTVRKNHSGNGIVVGWTRGAIVEYCEAHHNGWDMTWTGNGPVGIWTYESDNVVIRHCISHHNRSTAEDGGGFDLDGGVTNSVLEYNESHDNFGAGYLICQYAGASAFADNIVRYNVSRDDGLMAHDAGIYVWVGGAGMKSALVHGNTVFNTKGSAVAIVAVKRYEEPRPVFTFRDNTFVSRGPQIRGAARGRFLGNTYWAPGERGFNVDGFKDFDKWVAATGQEQQNGKTVGRFADPGFTPSSLPPR